MFPRLPRVGGWISLVGLFTQAMPAMAQPAATVHAVTPTNRLLTFSAASPGAVLRSVAVSNLMPGETLAGIDVRPATKWLYGLGTSGQLYIINHVSGAAIRIGTPLAPAVVGAAVGFDFNPTVDRIRVVTSTGQNLRVHPETAAVTVDTPLVFNAADRNAGAVPRVVAAGYTNPDTNPATGTTLFVIDAALGIGATQNPPNAGVLNTFTDFGTTTTDAVSLDFDATDAYVAAMMVASSTSSFFQYTGGQMRLVGTIGGGEAVVGMAVSLGEPPTAPEGLVFAVTTTNQLTAFAADTPGVLLGIAPIANLPPAERIVGIDFRPANNLLYALGRSGQLYLLDTATAAASRVGPPLAGVLNGTSFGFDFNPVVDRIRVVSDTGQNLRLHPDTGALAAADTNLSYAPADRNAGRAPRAVAAAYTNPDTNPATGTTLFVIDTAADAGAIQDPPNAGVLNTFAPLGLDASDLVGFDIGRRRSLVSVVPGGASVPWLFDVTTRPAFLGVIGTSTLVEDIAISLGR